MAQWARDSQGQMLFPTNGNGADAITTDAQTCAQIKIGSVLEMVRGEWFLDPSKGVPWLQIWAQKNPSVEGVKQLFRKQLLAIDVGMPPIARIKSFTAALNRLARAASYAGVVVLSDGTVVVLGSPTQGDS